LAGLISVQESSGSRPLAAKYIFNISFATIADLGAAGHSQPASWLQSDGAG
jgi:hypothetical protein